MHTRLRINGKTLDDTNVSDSTRDFLAAVRKTGLDVHEGMSLPDMALLAMLQHHGAATPLLDVSLDPVVGLYMAVVSQRPADADNAGALFAIRRPKVELSAFDSRDFPSIWSNLASDEVVLYSAPDVSERLRIQRGHFLLGRVSSADRRVTIPLTLDDRAWAKRWITKRMNARGKKGPPAPATSDIAIFRIGASYKEEIRTWLEARSGLTRDFVFPTSWHQPHMDRFAIAHGRTAAFI